MKINLEDLKNLISIEQILKEIGTNSKKSKYKYPLHNGKNNISQF